MTRSNLLAVGMALALGAAGCKSKQDEPKPGSAHVTTESKVAPPSEGSPPSAAVPAHVTAFVMRIPPELKPTHVLPPPDDSMPVHMNQVSLSGGTPAYWSVSEWGSTERADTIVAGPKSAGGKAAEQLMAETGTKKEALGLVTGTKGDERVTFRARIGSAVL